jgi:hypothetical protein
MKVSHNILGTALDVASPLRKKELFVETSPLMPGSIVSRVDTSRVRGHERPLRNAERRRRTMKKGGSDMRKALIAGLGLFLLAGCGARANAGEGLVETVEKGCEKELTAYCSQVTPGEGRVLACLYAYGDKLSGRCEYALYDAAVQLERAVAALSYAANECGDDLEKYCAAVEMGEGRLLKCLDKHDDKVSKRCKQALKDTGLK